MPRLRTIQKCPVNIFEGKQVSKANQPGGRPEFEQGEADAEADKLKKFIDAGRSQMQWLSDAGRTNFRITSGIISLLKKDRVFLFNKEKTRSFFIYLTN
jgi:hypothetical protein